MPKRWGIIAQSAAAAAAAVWLRWELQRISSSINGSRCCRQLVVGPCLHLSAIPDLLKPFFQRLLLLCRVSAALVNGMSVRECIVVLHVARVGNRRLRFCDCCSRYFCTCSVHTAVFAGVGGVHRSAILAEHTGCSTPVSHFGTCPPVCLSSTGPHCVLAPAALLLSNSAYCWCELKCYSPFCLGCVRRTPHTCWGQLQLCGVLTP